MCPNQGQWYPIISCLPVHVILKSNNRRQLISVDIDFGVTFSTYIFNINWPLKQTEGRLVTIYILQK